MQDNKNTPKKGNFGNTTDDGRQKYTNMYTGAENKPTQIHKEIPYNKWLIDSAKFYIPTHAFTKIDIPNEFILLNKGTGEVIDDFKKNSLTIPYKNHKIYLGREKKVIPKKNGNNIVYDNVVIYFPAKIDIENYFNGITINLMAEVLQFLKDELYFDYKDIHELIYVIECKDLDIKIDRRFDWSDKEKLVKYNKILKERFNGLPNMVNTFNNEKNGVGLQTYKREISTISKPFCKFYSKSDEVKSYINEFPADIIEELENFLIYRYEYTIKNIAWFRFFGISNLFHQIIELPQEKLKEIGIYYLNTNFQKDIYKPIKNNKQTPMERIFTLLIFDLIQIGKNKNYIENIFTQEKNKVQRLRNKTLFNNCYYYASTPNENTRQLVEDYSTIKDFDEIFGFHSNITNTYTPILKNINNE
jgi:hypothetical protein